MENLPSLPLCPVAARYTYHVIDSNAAMPSSCWGRYKRVAILRVDRHERPADFEPRAIRNTRGVEIVRSWERLSVGSTERCAYRAALALAHNLADEIRTHEIAD